MKTSLMSILFIVGTLFADAPKESLPHPTPPILGEYRGCWTGRVANDRGDGHLVAEFQFESDKKTIWLAIPEDFPFDPECFNLQVAQ